MYGSTDAKQLTGKPSFFRAQTANVLLHSQNSSFNEIWNKNSLEDPNSPRDDDNSQKVYESSQVKSAANLRASMLPCVS